MPRKKSGLFDQSKYIQQFMRENVTVKKVTFNKETDADLLAWLADKRFSTYVKDLIRSDIRSKWLHLNAPDQDNIECKMCDLCESDAIRNCSTCEVKNRK